MKKLTVRQLALDAMLSAMCAVLAYVSLTFGNVRLSFESFPVLAGALLFGPVDGMLVGGVGTLLYQLLGYGLTATTLLWVLPYVAGGALTGWYARKGAFSLTRRQTLMIVMGNELLITALNTFAIYVDSRVYGYYYPGIILGVLALRLGMCVLRGLAYAAALPPLLRALRKGYRKTA